MRVESTVFKRPTTLQHRIGYSRLALPVLGLQPPRNHSRLQDNGPSLCVALLLWQAQNSEISESWVVPTSHVATIQIIQPSFRTLHYRLLWHFQFGGVITDVVSLEIFRSSLGITPVLDILYGAYHYLRLTYCLTGSTTPYLTTLVIIQSTIVGVVLRLPILTEVAKTEDFPRRFAVNPL